MELHILPILTFLSIALVVSQAALPPEIYWKKMLPNTDMPNAIKNSLPKTEWMEDKGTSVNVGKGGVHVNTGGPKHGSGGTTVDVGPHKGGVHVNTGGPKHGSGGTTVDVGPHKGVGVSTQKPNGGHTNVNVGPKSGVGVNTGKPNEGHTNVNVGPKSAVAVNTGKPDGGHTDVNVGPKSGVGVNTGKPNGGHTDVNVGPKSGVGVNTGKPNGGHTDVNVGPKSGVGVHTGKPSGGHTDVNVGPKHGVGVNTEHGGTHVGVGKGGVTVHGNPHKKPVYVGVKPGPNPFKYNYAASEAQLHDDPTRALFFLEKDMKVGHSMNLHFTKNTNEATFLPVEEANSLPFSSDKIPAILREFSVKPNSEEAETIKETIKGCERKGIQGEQKYCATSLESMVEYVKNSLGNNVKAMSTDIKGTENNIGTYTITSVKKVSDENEAAICHKQKYAYAVFYCHKSKGTSAYMVSLMGTKGSNSNAMAVCHKDTKAWNPKHLAFQVLNVKPGSVPVCHFLPEDHIVWAPY